MFYDKVCVQMDPMEPIASVEAEWKGEVKRKMVDSDDAVLSQLVQLQVAEGLPRTDDCDVCW